MILKIVKTTALAALLASALNAANYNAQAEKDRIALVKYFEAKFEDPLKNKNTFFPYSTDDELKNNIMSGLKFQDFSKGNYAFSKNGRVSYDAIKEFPPTEEWIDVGQELYTKKFANGKSFANCFPDPAKAGSMYPYFDEKTKEVITLTLAVNQCLEANGEKKWGTSKGKIAYLEAYLVSEARDAEKVIDVKIQSADAAAAYERGKEYYYTQRGYLKLNCAECHVQGAAQRVRNESLSQLLGQTSHFPVYRLKWGAKNPANGLGTLERRMSGCIKDQGQVPPKATSKEMKELLFFMAYMNNGMKIDGPDFRK
ncbi:MAG: sulfur oxidation c-type cytochrome SoxA [Halarcobacter sp.]